MLPPCVRLEGEARPPGSLPPGSAPGRFLTRLHGPSPAGQSFPVRGRGAGPHRPRFLLVCGSAVLQGHAKFVAFSGGAARRSSASTWPQSCCHCLRSPLVHAPVDGVAFAPRERSREGERCRAGGLPPRGSGLLQQPDPRLGGSLALPVDPDSSSGCVYGQAGQGLGVAHAGETRVVEPMLHPLRDRRPGLVRGLLHPLVSCDQAVSGLSHQVRATQVPRPPCPSGRCGPPRGEGDRRAGDRAA
jgi:hypothetical protein